MERFASRYQCTQLLAHLSQTDLVAAIDCSDAQHVLLLMPNEGEDLSRLKHQFESQLRISQAALQQNPTFIQERSQYALVRARGVSSVLIECDAAFIDQDLPLIALITALITAVDVIHRQQFVVCELNPHSIYLDRDGQGLNAIFVDMTRAMPVASTINPAHWSHYVGFIDGGLLSDQHYRVIHDYHALAKLLRYVAALPQWQAYVTPQITSFIDALQRLDERDESDALDRVLALLSAAAEGEQIDIALPSSQSSKGYAIPSEILGLLSTVSTRFFHDELLLRLSKALGRSDIALWQDGVLLACTAELETQDKQQIYSTAIAIDDNAVFVPFNISSFCMRESSAQLLFVGELSTKAWAQLETYAELMTQLLCLHGEISHGRAEAGLPRHIVNSATIGLMLLDGDSVVYLNPYLQSYLLNESQDLDRYFLSDCIAGDNYQAVKAFIHRSGAQGETTALFHTSVRTISGDVKYVKLLCNKIHWFDKELTQCWLIDDSDYREREQIETDLLEHDQVTALLSRQYFHQQLEILVESHEHFGALMVIDLDRFKFINDSLGLAAGDALLELISKRLSDQMSDTQLAARVGDDEFAILLSGFEYRSDAAVIVEKVLKCLSAPYLVNQQEVFVSFSAGVAMFPEDSAEVGEILRYADMAMCDAKLTGGDGYMFFQAEMDQSFKRRKDIGQRLRESAERVDDFVLLYQPLVDAKTGQTRCFEALLRWVSEDEGFISPMEFIPVAEATGLIVPIGRWVLYEACRQASEWRQAGYGDIPVAVNISAVQLNADNFVATVHQALVDTGLPARLLELEVTESMMMESVHEVSVLLRELADLGVRIAVDDFGTGYSSLSYLQHLPVHKLKIDRSFVSGLAPKNKDAAVAKTIISLAHNLDLDVVAEGVETIEQMNFLKQNGCDYLQGFFFSKPMFNDDISDWLGQSERMMP